jgi:quercetin dioxygenase-like cupin family protein
MPSWVKWEGLPWEEVTEKVSRKVVMNDRMMMVCYRFRAHSSWPEERHEASQGGYILQGKILLKLPEQGEEIQLGPGDGYLIESYKAHSWEVMGEDVILIDFFSPPRRELLHRER